MFFKFSCGIIVFSWTRIPPRDCRPGVLRSQQHGSPHAAQNGAKVTREEEQEGLYFVFFYWATFTHATLASWPLKPFPAVLVTQPLTARTKSKTNLRIANAFPTRNNSICTCVFQYYRQQKNRKGIHWLIQESYPPGRTKRTITSPRYSVSTWPATEMSVSRFSSAASSAPKRKRSNQDMSPEFPAGC